VARFLDRKLERLGHRFCSLWLTTVTFIVPANARSAGDERQNARSSKQKLKLKVNEAKSAVADRRTQVPWVQLLGWSGHHAHDPRLKISVVGFKRRIRRSLEEQGR